VTDENGVPVGAAEIQLKHVNGQAYKAETDGAWRFPLRNLPSGDYQVEIRTQDFFLLSAEALPPIRLYPAGPYATRRDFSSPGSSEGSLPVGCTFRAQYLL
jgi:hypothetical protein